MEKQELNDLYFDWMYQLVCNDNSHRKLLCCLHDIEFIYTIPMDENRQSDGEDLRYRFGYERGYNDAMIASYLDDKPCSVLEMMVALSLRCEEQIMHDPDVGDRIQEWFWTMITNLYLDFMSDDKFNEQTVIHCVNRFMNREYKPNGEGGLFVVDRPRRDMRTVEIWYQMCWYLSEYLGYR